jgi:hypothetical protein
VFQVTWQQDANAIRVRTVDPCRMEDALQMDLVEYIAELGDGLGRPVLPDWSSGTGHCVHLEHTLPFHPGVKAERCVQNEHTSHPRSNKVMSAHRLLFCLAMLGWGERELARQLRRHQTDIRRWIDAATIPQDVATWLEDLVTFHQAHPPPRKQRKAAARPKKPALSLA